MDSVCLYKAYLDQINQLLLKEYPCGIGSWREDYDLIDKAKTDKTKSQKPLNPKLIDTKFAVTLKDVDPQKERIESLSELIHASESPWTSDYSWSDEAQHIRDLSIKEPWKMSTKHINSLFRTLRIIDKEVTTVDYKMTSLSNLETLVLSANYIEWLDSNHLPKSLKSLELCGNFISDLSGFIRNSPPLEHLGLGRNNLDSIENHLNGLHWPQLLSLDLGHNHLTDTNALLETLATLPKLRTLVLEGNPLTLTPGYRGLTVDRLRSLIILDDIRISADERHQCKGFVRRRDFLPMEVRLRLAATRLKNLPVPPEIACPEDFPEFPIVQRKYFLRFWLPESCDDSVEAFSDDQDMQKSSTSESLHAAFRNRKLQKSASLMSDITEEPQDADVPVGTNLQTVKELPVVPSRVIGDIVCSPVLSSIHSYGSLTPEGELELDWTADVIRHDLREFRDFLKTPLVMEVVEEMSHLYPPNELPTEGDEQSKTTKDDKKRDDASKKDDGKPKKKKKIDESQLVVYSQELISLVELNVDVSSLLEGSQKLDECLTANIDYQTLTSSQTDKKQKEHKEKIKEDKKKVKSATKKKPAVEAAEDVAEEVVSPPLEVNIALELIRWSSPKEVTPPVSLNAPQNVPTIAIS